MILSLTPYSHDVNYKSAGLMGYASIVEDQEEKLWAMELVTNKVVTGRWSETRVPPRPPQMSSTGVLRVKIESGSGKVRAGVAHDEKGDEENEQVRQRVWTGVVPVMEVFGEPVPDGGNQIEEVPGFLRAFVEKRTKAAESEAMAAMREDPA